MVGATLLRPTLRVGWRRTHEWLRIAPGVAHSTVRRVFLGEGAFCPATARSTGLPGCCGSRNSRRSAATGCRTERPSSRRQSLNRKGDTSEAVRGFVHRCDLATTVQRVGGEIGSHDSQGLAKHNVGTTEPRFEGKPTPPYLQGSAGGRPVIVAHDSPPARLATKPAGQRRRTCTVPRGFFRTLLGVGFRQALEGDALVQGEHRPPHGEAYPQQSDHVDLLGDEGDLLRRQKPA